MNHSSKPGMSFSLGANHLHAVARFDAIRNDTLVQLVQHWVSDPQSRDETIAALDELAAIVSGPRREGELDEALEQVDDVASMEYPQIEIDRVDARRLLEELTEVVRRISRGRGASDIKHPSMLPTRKHLAANPLPGQREAGAA